MAMTFYQRAKALFPQMPEWVLLAYKNGLAQNGGNGELAWTNVRQHPKYDLTFAGNRRKDGSFRMTEVEYFATKDAYRQHVRDYGLNPDILTGRYDELIAGDVSVQEFGARLEAANQQIVNNTKQVREFYANNYGINLTDQAIFASFIDPDVGKAVLERRISVSQIGGEAALRGFDVGVSRANRLADMGVTQDQARGIYSQAQDRLGGLNTLADRYNDLDPTFDLDEFEDASLGDAGQMRRAERLVQAETSSFSGQRRVREDQTGGLSGLRQQ